MTIHSDLTTIQNCVGNRLDDAGIGDRRIAVLSAMRRRIIRRALRYGTPSSMIWV